MSPVPVWHAEARNATNAKPAPAAIKHKRSSVGHFPADLSQDARKRPKTGGAAEQRDESPVGTGQLSPAEAAKLGRSSLAEPLMRTASLVKNPEGVENLGQAGERGAATLGSVRRSGLGANGELPLTFDLSLSLPPPPE